MELVFQVPGIILIWHAILHFYFRFPERKNVLFFRPTASKSNKNL